MLAPIYPVCAVPTRPTRLLLTNHQGHKQSLGPFNLSDTCGRLTCTPHFWNHYQDPKCNAVNSTNWISTFFDNPAWKARFPQIQTWFRKTTWAGPDGPVSCDPKGQFVDCCMFPTGTVANYSVMVNTPASGRCAHNLTRYCSWYNLSAHFCGADHGAFGPPVGCWPDDAQFQRVGPQRLYTEDPGFVDMAAENFALKPDSRIFADFRVSWCQQSPCLASPWSLLEGRSILQLRGEAGEARLPRRKS